MGIVELMQRWLEDIRASDDKPRRLREIIEENRDIDTDSFFANLYESYSHDDIGAAQGLIVGPLNVLMAQNDEIDVFYRRIWSFIESNELIVGDTLEQIVLAIVVTHIGMPYQQAKTVTMDDGEYRLRMKELVPTTRDLIGMVRRHFPQKTQGSAAVLNIIEEQQDERDRALLMAVLMDYLRNEGIGPMPSIGSVPVPASGAGQSEA